MIDILQTAQRALPETSKDKAQLAREIAKLVSLVENRTPDQHIMVMLDMFRMPERVNEFNKDPFPHYVMLGPTLNPDEWFVYDPDYRWEGVSRKERILHAMRHPDVGGGYLFSDKTARAPTPKQIAAYYDACMLLHTNPMTEAIRQTVKAHVAGHDKNGAPLPLADLGKATELVALTLLDLLRRA